MSTFENNQNLFTAHQIAAALSVSRQSVFKVLKVARPSGTVLKGGRPVNAWRFLDLPADLRARLDTEADKLGFRNAEELLDRGRTPWQPKVPLKEVAERYVQKAAKLQKALLPIMEQLSDLDSLASVEEYGLELYRDAFGRSTSGRNWQRLVKRTFDRDRGNNNFQRLELYLDDKLQRVCKQTAQPPKSAQDAFEGVRAAITMVENPARPTVSEKELIWAQTMQALEGLQADGMSEKEANRIALEFLNSEAVFIAKNEAALRAAFYRKLKAFKKAGGHLGAVKDQRSERSGNFRAPKLTKEDRITILGYAKRAGCRLSQGWREAYRDKALSPELMQHYSLDERQNKSYVPAAIREELAHEVKMINEWSHGPHCAKMNGAYLERDPNGIRAGDWLQLDETTPPFYWHNDRDPRKPTRGQLMIGIDVRTGFIYSHVVANAKAFNGRDARNLITKTHDAYGLPRVGFYFENSIFKSKAVKSGIAWSETERGMVTGLNLKFVHAREARSKLVERVFGLLQNYFERIPGYCGREERWDHYERTQKTLQQIRGGKVPSVEVLLTQEEISQRVEEAIHLVNNDPQNGIYLKGLSPAEAYLKYFGDVPLVKLGRTTRYLLADSVEKVRIGRNGISIVRGKERFTYKNESTGRLKGKEVLAWFSPESPDVLCVTDLKKRNPFTVERAQAVPLMSADADLLADETARNESHNAYGKRIFQTVTQEFPDDFKKRMFAPNVADEETTVLGLEMEYQRQQAGKKQKQQTKQKQKIARTGLKASPLAERRSAQAEAAPRLAAWLKDGE